MQLLSLTTSRLLGKSLSLLCLRKSLPDRHIRYLTFLFLHLRHNLHNTHVRSLPDTCTRCLAFRALLQFNFTFRDVRNFMHLLSLMLSRPSYLGSFPFFLQLRQNLPSTHIRCLAFPFLHLRHNLLNAHISNLVFPFLLRLMQILPNTYTR